MTPRVLILSKACIVGIYQRKLEEIAACGYDLRVLVPPSWRDERGEQPLERVHTNGYDLRATPIRLNGRFHLHFYPRLLREIAAFRPHLVHIDEEPYNLATWQALWGARRVGARTLFFTWQNIPRHYPPPFGWGERWVLDTVDAAIVGTEGAAQVWRGKGFTKPMAVIPQFGVDTERFQPPARRATRPFTIGYVGRLVAEKGIHLLLEAVAQLGGDWRLQIVGGGPQRQALAEQARRLDIHQRVSFTPQMPSTDILSVYHQLDVLVLPSLTRPNWKEQFGRVLVEAMACGVAVVGSDSGAIPNVIGDAGYIFPEGDALALRQRLRSLQTEPEERARMAARGRARVLAQFTHQQIARATVAFYERVLATQT